MADRLPGVTKRQFEQTLDRIGIWAVHTRQDRRFRCRSCYNLDTHDGPADCQTCFGTGYQVTLERWLVYYAINLRRPQAIEGEFSTIGIDTSNTPVLFSRRQDVPQIGDRIFLVEWDVPRDRQDRHGHPVRLVQPLYVKFVEPEILAEVIYYVAHVEIQHEQADQYARALHGARIPPRRPGT